MSGDDKPPRRLSDDDEALWHAVTRSIAPLKRRRIRRGEPEGVRTSTRLQGAPQLKPVLKSPASLRMQAGPGGPLLLYSLDPRDTAKTLAGIALAAEVYLAAGAKEVHTLLPGLPPVRSRADLRGIIEGRWRASDLKLSAYHPMGTCRLGADARSSVVDEYGNAWDVPGLVLADASILPGSTAVNPQITIMALATRVARRLAATLS